ncbi:meiotic chromosome segregation protein [Drechmeria coniospora]|uniref:Meiotic chromosome segregation protein n=1 Tax=Drechmeria coniospora TaxID=98403 RepID=A0A151GGC0_DRECN|nr:meiotic chromosome segregation protein [Drechmeria coniospora]KYK56150.1 meiotic chromosome segregation protein [Drechmeria coniospora]
MAHVVAVLDGKDLARDSMTCQMKYRTRRAETRRDRWMMGGRWHVDVLVIPASVKQAVPSLARAQAYLLPACSLSYLASALKSNIGMAQSAQPESVDERLKGRLNMPKPVPAFLPTVGSPLTVDKQAYDEIQQAPRVLVDEFTLPIRSGKAWEAPAGSIIRISTPDGPQVGDLNLWNRHNPRERFWASRTRQLHASHLGTYDRLWSSLPYMRPLATIVHDSLAWYGADQHGARVHDLLGTRCDPYIKAVLTSGAQYDFHCHSNLVRAVAEFGLAERDVHDVINLFQATGLDDEGRYFMNPCPAQRGDNIELLAEQDLLLALSAYFSPRASVARVVNVSLG